MCEYNKDPSNLEKFTLNSNLDWPMPKAYYKSIGVTVEGFSFTFPNTKKTIKDIITPKDNLINIELGLELIENGLTPEFFFLKKRNRRKSAVPTKQFINESYFLYDKSFLVKKTFVTAINKTISIYGSFSHFQGKTAEDGIQLLDASNFLKFLIKKKTP